MPDHDMSRIVGTHDILWVTLDTLRYDVAQSAWEQGRTPHLARLLPASGWERRHSPGSFTYSAHHAFFAGFLPTPVQPGRHPRLFAAAFPGSETTGPGTFVFDAADVPAGLRARGYRSICIGGVGFFNKRTALGSVLPNLFDESHWLPEFGVTNPESTREQVAAARARLDAAGTQRVFLFLNVSALHQPNCGYTPGATQDSPQTMADALGYVDSQLKTLIEALRKRGPCFFAIMSDHGTAYGEGGLFGHRLAHPVVWEVPYADGFIV